MFLKDSGKKNKKNKNKAKVLIQCFAFTQEKTPRLRWFTCKPQLRHHGPEDLQEVVSKQHDFYNPLRRNSVQI